MNYNYLRYFSVLAEVEHYTLAAARLGISQPSLSSAIHNLENSLGGVKLFEKVGRNIRLTEEGRYFREKVDTALQDLHLACVTVRDSRMIAPVVIRMGLVSGTLEGMASDLITSYIKENPRIRFRITEGASADLMDMVREEKLDIAIVDTTSRDRSLHFRKLCERDIYVALPADHPLASSKVIDPEAIMHEPQIAFNYDVNNSFHDWASGTPIDEHVICSVNTAQAALNLVGAGVGIAFIPNECIQERKDVCFLRLKNWHEALYMCILYDQWLEPPIWDFVEKVVREFREVAGDNKALE